MKPTSTTKTSSCLSIQIILNTTKFNVQAQSPQQVPYQAAQAYAAPQPAPPSIGSQGSSQRQFQFQPAGQGLSPHSTPNVSVSSVPKFLEEAWAKGASVRESPPPLPGKSCPLCLLNNSCLIELQPIQHMCSDLVCCMPCMPEICLLTSLVGDKRLSAILGQLFV